MDGWRISGALRRLETEDMSNDGLRILARFERKFTNTACKQEEQILPDHRLEQGPHQRWGTVNFWRQLVRKTDNHLGQRFSQRSPVRTGSTLRDDLHLGQLFCDVFLDLCQPSLAECVQCKNTTRNKPSATLETPIVSQEGLL